MSDDKTLLDLSARLDQRQKLIDQLATGMQQTNDLVAQLQKLSSQVDDRVTALTQQIANDTRVSDISTQVQNKNTQLSGLVQKLSTTVTSSLPKVGV